MKLGIYGGTFNLFAVTMTPPGRRPGWRWWSWPPTACSCPAG